MAKGKVKAIHDDMNLGIVRKNNSIYSAWLGLQTCFYNLVLNKAVILK